jgi:hypothetical protein
VAKDPLKIGYYHNNATHFSPLSQVPNVIEVGQAAQACLTPRQKFTAT